MDLFELPTEAIRSLLCEIVQNQLNSRNFQLNVSSASENGETNFIGILYRISFSKADIDESGEGKNAQKLILKVAPQDMEHRQRRFTRPTFMREIHMYDKVSLKISISIVPFDKMEIL